MKPVKIAWNRFSTVPVPLELHQALDEATLAEFVKKVTGARHPAFQLAEDLFVEIPAADWGHGDHYYIWINVNGQNVGAIAPFCSYSVR